MRRRVLKPYTGPRVPGIDVSHHQGAIPWGKVSTDPKVRFAIVRIGDGEDLDRRFEENAISCADAKIRRGFYFYVRLDRTPEEQIELITSAIDRIGGFLPTDMVPFLDVEGIADDPTTKVDEGTGSFQNVVKSDPPPDPEEALLRLLAMVLALQKWMGLPPGIYSGQTWHWVWAQKLGFAKLLREFRACPFWVPWYVSNPLRDPRMPCNGLGHPAPWQIPHIHQWTGSGSVLGIPKVDQNNFFGTEDQLERELCFKDRKC